MGCSVTAHRGGGGGDGEDVDWFEEGRSRFPEVAGTAASVLTPPLTVFVTRIAAVLSVRLPLLKEFLEIGDWGGRGFWGRC